MDFSFSDDQNAIRDLAHQIFTDRVSDEFLLGFDRNDDVYDDVLWNTLAEQGLLGIVIPEQFGGTGLGFTELCLMLEEQGRRVAPVPLLSSLVMGAMPIIEFGSDAQQQKYLAPLATGAIKLSAAIAEIGMVEAIAGEVTATAGGDGWVLNGELACIPDGGTADAILVPATAGDKKVVFIVDTASSGVGIDVQQSSLGMKEANLALSDVSVKADAVLGEDGEAVLAFIEQYTQVAICATQTGVTAEMLKRTAEFTCERKQFGVPIGSFQAVAMQAADAFIDVEAIRSVYLLALNKITSGQDARAEVHCAMWYTSEAGHRVVYKSQHLHGGMGVDLEYPSHRFFLWAKHLGMMLGGRGVQLEKLGALLASDDSVGVAALEI